MELEPEIKVHGLECNRSLLEGVPFVNNMVIEEPEYGIFFTDVFSDQAFQRWNDIHKVGIDSLVSYLVMASMIKTLENARFSLKLKKLITKHPTQEKLQAKKVKLEAVGFQREPITKVPQPKNTNLGIIKGTFASVLKTGNPNSSSFEQSNPALVLDDSCIMERDFGRPLIRKVKYVTALPTLYIILAQEDTVMSDSEDSTVTYTAVSSPFADLPDIGSPRVDGPPVMPEDPYAYVVAAFQAPPSPDYVSGPEEPEQEPPLPVYVPYVPEPTYPEFMPPEEESDPEEDPEEDDYEDPEEDPADYPADGGDDGDDEDESSDDDKDDDVDIEEDEEEEDEEQLAPVDSSTIALPAVDHAPSTEETEPFETDEYVAIPPPHPTYRVTTRISIRDEPPTSFWSDTESAYPLGYRAALSLGLRVRHSYLLPIHPPTHIITLHTQSRLHSIRFVHHLLLPIPLPTSSPSLLLPSADHEADRLEVCLPPRKRLCFALGPRYEVGESSYAAVARPTGCFRVDYGFVATMDREIRHDHSSGEMSVMGSPTLGRRDAGYGHVATRALGIRTKGSILCREVWLGLNEMIAGDGLSVLGTVSELGDYVGSGLHTLLASKGLLHSPGQQGQLDMASYVALGDRRERSQKKHIWTIYGDSIALMYVQLSYGFIVPSYASVLPYPNCLHKEGATSSRHVRLLLIWGLLLLLVLFILSCCYETRALLNRINIQVADSLHLHNPFSEAVIQF
ncbi:hypothetical protein Tco_0631143 [Tanacetum coccineum]